MTTLPSFVELMDSLGLDNDGSRAGPARGATPAHHSRSSSYSSSSSLPSPALRTVSSSIYPKSSSPIPISRQKQNAVDRDWDAEKVRSQSGRYSPYTQSLSHARKASMPSMMGKDMSRDQPLRALSTSPYLSSSPRIRQRSSTLAMKAATRRPERLALSESNLTANTPISTFVRRKTPQTSPVSPTFPLHSRKRSNSPAAPVSIPTVPLVFPPQSRYPSSDSDDEDMPFTPNTQFHYYHTFPRQTIKVSPPMPQYDSSGVRISAFAYPRDLDTQHRPAISPVA